MKKLSIITTVYKKGKVAVTQIKRLVSFIEKRNLKAEIIVVIDGLVNNDKKGLEEAKVKHNWKNNVKIFSYRLNRGKGFAQRFGFSKSTGDVVMFIDADTDILMKSVDIALNIFIKNEDVTDAVYPSKYLKDSDLDGTNKLRKLLSFGLKTLTFLMLGINKNIQDVSCGLKIFKRSAYNLFVDELFVDRFATDSEVYFWINKLNLNVISVPFFMNMPKGSTSTNIFEIVKVFFDLLSVVFKLKIQNSFKIERRVEYLQRANPIV